MAPFALGSLGVKGWLRHLSLLGAVAFRDFHVTARSWEPLFEELVKYPFALGSLGLKSLLLYRTLFYLASRGLRSGLPGVCLGPFWGPFGPFWGLFGTSWAVAGRLGVLGPSWDSLEGFLGPSWEPLGALSWCRLGAV